MAQPRISFFLESILGLIEAVMEIKKQKKINFFQNYISENDPNYSSKKREKHSKNFEMDVFEACWRLTHENLIKKLKF